MASPPRGPCVGWLRETRTRPSGATRPRAVVVPPTSTPRSSAVGIAVLAHRRRTRRPRSGPPSRERIAGQGALGVEGAEIVEPLVADAGKPVALERHHDRVEAGGAQPGLGAFDAEKAKQGEEEPAARPEMRGGLADQAVEQGPAIGAAIVGGGLGVVALAAGRRRHLRRARAHEIEAQARHRREAVAEARPPRLGHAVAGGVVPRARDRLPAGCRWRSRARPRARPAPRPGPRPQPISSTRSPGRDAEVPAEEERAGLGRLRARADAERAVAILEEEDALVVAHARLRPVARA